MFVKDYFMPLFFPLILPMMNEEIIIRKGVKSDLSAILDLIRLLAEFEKAPEEVTITLESLERDGFGEKPVFELLVACTQEQIVGMALYFSKYSTWKGRGIYLDDIVVSESHRNKGIGRKLFDALILEAQKTGAKQLHWQVLDWNEQAIGFYKKYDPSFDSTWINCKMTESQIDKYKIEL